MRYLVTLSNGDTFHTDFDQHGIASSPLDGLTMFSVQRKGVPYEEAVAFSAAHVVTIQDRRPN